MYYKTKHEKKIEQGDICCNLPKFLPSDLISEEPTSTTWENYIESLRENKIPKVKFSILPSPTWGVILTQTCDIENAKQGSSMLFCELNKYENYADIAEISISKQKKYNEKIIDIVRNEPAKHYLPKLKINDKRYTKKVIKERMYRVNELHDLPIDLKDYPF